MDVNRKLDPLGLSMNGGRTAYLVARGHTLRGANRRKVIDIH